MVTRGSGATHVGMVRDENEDVVHVDDGRGLYIVCDGMGGRSAGAWAAKSALATIATFLTEDHVGDEDPSQRLKEAVESANRTVHEEGERNLDRRGMACTATVLSFAADRAHIAHVGDTRLYLIRAGLAQQLTADHTLAAAMASAGIISPDEVRNHPRSNILTRAVGAAPDIMVDVLTVVTYPNDLFILCSDGLTRYVERSSDIGGLQASQVGEIPQQLIDLANTRGGKDNIAVVAVAVAADHEPTSLSGEQGELMEFATPSEG